MANGDRHSWINQLGRSILENVDPSLGQALLALCGNDPMIAAFIYVHILLSHVEGITFPQITAQLDGWRPNVDWSDVALDSISNFRRSGLDPPLSDDLLITWVSLTQFARERTDTASLPELSVRMVTINESLAQRAGSALDQRLSNEPDLDSILGTFLPVGSGRPSWHLPPGWTYRLDAPHLAAYREALFLIDEEFGASREAQAATGRRLLRELQSWLTPLELAALLPEPVERLLLDETLKTSRGIMMLPYFMIGEWADLYPNEVEPRVPKWVHDYVVTGGARSATYTTGSMHAWVLVSEGSWDFPRVSRTLKEIEQLGIVEDDSAIDLSILLPAYAGDLSPLAMDFHYNLTDPDGLRGILVMAATGYVKLDVYALSPGSLKFVGSRALSLPDELTRRLTDLGVRAIHEQLGAKPSRLLSANLERLAREVEAENRFAASEISRHELLWHVSLLADRGRLQQADREALEAARLGYLAAESKYARLLLVGQQVTADDVVGRPRAEFEELLAQDGGRWMASVPPLSTLGPTQAFLHVEYRDSAVDWVAAGASKAGAWYRWSPRDPDAAVEGALREFFRVRHSRTSSHSRAAAIDQLVHVLDESFAEMAAFLDELGVTEVIASPGAGLDGIPIHLLDFGSHSPVVSYAPSVKFLEAATNLRSEADKAEILSYAGSGHELIPHVTDEGAAIAALYGSRARQINNATPDDLFRALGSKVIHIACHGLALQQFALRGLLLAPNVVDGFVSTADVLRNTPMLGTELVYLSACSTSVADHRATVVQAFGGVDFAFIAAGATAVVAALWDVDDVLAAIFATSFHAGLAQGSTVSHAYRAAQQALSSDLDSLPPEAADALSHVWPSWIDEWRQAPMRSHPVHWGAFRLSGRI